MVQLPSTGKRQHVEPAEPPVSPPLPAATVKLEAEEPHGDEHCPLIKRAKAAQPPPPQQDMYHNVLDEPSPLGRRLRKSPSFLDLIQMRLSQANSNAGQSSMDNCSAEPPKKKDLQSGTSAAGERLKASSFPANILRIGTWERLCKD